MLNPIAVAAATAVCLWMYIRGSKATATDVHKPHKPRVVDNGGMVVALILAIAFAEISPWLGCCIIMAGICGILSSKFRLNWTINAILPLFAGIFLLPVTYYSPLIAFAGIAAVIGCCNASNMLEGYNGIGAGLTLLTSIALVLIAPTIITLYMAVSIAAVAAAFLWFNMNPAKVFPGDVGSYAFGAAIAITVLYMGWPLWVFGASLFLLHFLNLAMFTWGVVIRAKHVKFATVTPEGTLIAPESFWKHYLPFAVIKSGVNTERKVVDWFFVAQAYICTCAVLGYYVGMIL